MPFDHERLDVLLERIVSMLIKLARNLEAT